MSYLSCKIHKVPDPKMTWTEGQLDMEEHMEKIENYGQVL